MELKQFELIKIDEIFLVCFQVKNTKRYTFVVTLYYLRNVLFSRIDM